MKLTVQRFEPGHPLYSEASDFHNEEYYKATFGQLVDEQGRLICFTMERRDTLIPEGEYSFSYYKSPANKAVVPLLHAVPSFEYIEVHVANYPHEAKGCTAVGMGIDVHKPMLISSGKAFAALMDKLNMEAGTIKYETLKQIT